MPPRAEMIGPLTDALALTDEQASALEVILVDADKAIPPLVQTMGEKCKALHEGLTTGSNLTALVKAANDAESAVTTASLAVWAKIRTQSGLTADQLAKLATGPVGPPPLGPPGPPPGARQR